MSVFGRIFGAAAAQPIEAVGNVLDKLFTSEDEKLEKKLIMERLLQQPSIAQIELNKVEAQHRSVFVSGWRPWMGWICGFGVAYSVLIQPIATGFGFSFPELPDSSYNLLITLTLGLAGLRTGEKFGGRTK